MRRSAPDGNSIPPFFSLRHTEQDPQFCFDSRVHPLTVFFNHNTHLVTPVWPDIKRILSMFKICCLVFNHMFFVILCFTFKTEPGFFALNFIGRKLPFLCLLTLKELPHNFILNSGHYRTMWLTKALTGVQVHVLPLTSLHNVLQKHPLQSCHCLQWDQA